MPSTTATDPPPGSTTGTTTTTTTTPTIPAVKQVYAVGADAGNDPMVQVYNPDGTLLYSFLAYDANFRGGVFVAAADLTGDGVADIITGAGPSGGPHVKVFDGVTLAVVRSFFAYDPSFMGGVYVG